MHFSRGFVWVRNLIKANKVVTVFFLIHILLAVFLGRLYALAPDEVGYMYTFNNVYRWPINPWAQSGSGWVAAPTIFLWFAYSPAKLLNIIGVPDYLSLRILSIIITTISLSLLLSIQRSSHYCKMFSQKIIFIAYIIPSVFLWTSVGLRESFIIVEIALFLAGLNLLFKQDSFKALVLIFLGSYGLVSTKAYLWAILMVALILTVGIFLLIWVNRKKIFKLIVAGLLIPLIAFGSTTSAYALNFIFQADVTATGSRSGDSISQVYVDAPETGTGTGTETETETLEEPKKELITFHGDYTLIALRLYLINNPNSPLTKIFKAFHLDKKIESIWDEKIALGLVSKDNQIGIDTSSLNGHILEPGKIDEPLSLIWPAFVFLFGPFPFIGVPGIAVFISSFESPLWWAFYALVLFQFFKFRKTRFLRDPQILFTLIFLAGEIAFSALVEVNLGTSFRHRSIILIPLVFLYVRLAQRASEQKEKELGII